MTGHLDHHNPIPPEGPGESHYFGDIAFGTRRFGKLIPSTGLVESFIDPDESDTIEWGTKNNRAVALSRFWLHLAQGYAPPERMVKEFTEEVTSKLNRTMFVLEESWVNAWVRQWHFWRMKEREAEGGV